MTTSEQQAVPVEQEDRDAAAKLYEWFPAMSSSRDAGLKTAQFVRDGGADGWNTVQHFARHRLLPLPCKSGEGAGECTCGCAGDPFICIEADGTDRAAPEGLDTRCGFGAGSPKSPEWLAACELLALRYDHWKLTDKAAQIRGGHPSWLVEHACVEAIAALSTPSEQFAKSSPDAEVREALEPFVKHWQPWMDERDENAQDVRLAGLVALFKQSPDIHNPEQAAVDIFERLLRTEEKEKLREAAVEAGARAMCDRVNYVGYYDENIAQRRSGWLPQARACITAYLASLATPGAPSLGESVA